MVPLAPKPTYTTPTIARNLGEAVITYDVHLGQVPHRRESIALERTADGGIAITSRDTVIDMAALIIPAPIVPVVLAEIDRLLAHDEEVVFEPISSTNHITLLDFLSTTDQDGCDA